MVLRFKNVITYLLYNSDLQTYGFIFFIFFVIFLCFYIENKRMNKMVNELIEILQNEELKTL